MTRLLLLSVQSIFKNLNKIRGKVLHLSEQSLDAFNEPRESFIELWGYSQEQCKEVTHTSEGKLTEQRRSMRRRAERTPLLRKLRDIYKPPRLRPLWWLRDIYLMGATTPP